MLYDVRQESNAMHSGVHKVCKMEYEKMTAGDSSKAEAPPSTVPRTTVAPSALLVSALLLTLGVGAGYLMGKKK